MEILKYILIGIFVINCLALIIITMMQSKEDSGLSGTITGAGAKNYLDKNKGRTKEGRVKRLTIIASIAFAIITIALNFVYPLA